MANNIFYLQESKIYLLLAIFVYSFSFVVVIFYTQLLLTIVLSLLIIYFAVRFFYKIKHNDNSVVNIRINKASITWQIKTGKERAKVIAKPVFSSVFLLIIALDKQNYLVIFPDSLKYSKISHLNYLFAIAKYN